MHLETWIQMNQCSYVFLQAILQALEYLLIKGYAPRRGFYIGFGHDEEVGEAFIKL